jgi:hypothetical protein
LSVSYRDFLAIHKALQGLGLIEVLPGFYRRTSPFGDRSPEPHGKATRFRATPRLNGLSEEFGIRRGEAKRHFIRTSRTILSCLRRRPFATPGSKFPGIRCGSSTTTGRECWKPMSGRSMSSLTGMT